MGILLSAPDEARSVAEKPEDSLASHPPVTSRKVFRRDHPSSGDHRDQGRMDLRRRTRVQEAGHPSPRMGRSS